MTFYSHFANEKNSLSDSIIHTVKHCEVLSTGICKWKVPRTDQVQHVRVLHGQDIYMLSDIQQGQFYSQHIRGKD